MRLLTMTRTSDGELASELNFFIHSNNYHLEMFGVRSACAVNNVNISLIPPVTYNLQQFQ